MLDIIERKDFIFNTNVEQKIYTSKLSDSLVLDKATNMMIDLEKRLNFYDSSSEISQINKYAGHKFVKVSFETFELIKQSIKFSQKTDGLFDISVAPLVSAWKINSKNPNILKKEEAKKIASIVNYKDILLDDNNLSIMLKHENQKIDLGAIAKGYIADKIINLYKENNITSAVINIGGNVKVLGRKENKSLWKVGIYEPVKHSQYIIGALELENMSAVTSGGYERAFLSEGKVYHHILDPHTGYPADTDLKSITIVSKESILGDAFSTPLFMMGKYMACDFMKFNNLSGVMISKDDEIIITKDLLHKFNLFCDKKVLSY